jgi:hypothetical protein
MFFESLVQSRLLYAAETLAVTAAHLRQLEHWQLERCRVTFISLISRSLPQRQALTTFGRALRRLCCAHRLAPEAALHDRPRHRRSDPIRIS